ncbi:YadA-like family protein [Burkholderia cenocepacia]|nr:YadA-like family protein [Burkholderia cenocepacia]MBN3565501.1 YadA-like family protein [Burkholderia cenocepacia]
MNKSYRTVWNATTGTWAAAPETARMRTKSKSNSAMRSSVTAAVAVMAGVGGGAMSADANAQAANGNGTIGVCGPAGSGGRTFGYSGGFVNIPCVTTGGNPGADALYQGRAASFILTNDANQYGQGTGNTNVPVSSMAGITGSKNGHLVLLGGSGVHISGPADFNNNVNMTNHRINNLAAGVAGTDAVNLNQLNSAIAAAKTTANPYVVTNTGTYAAATAARAGGSATAVGANANASGISAVALGGNTVATGQNAVALGTLANATGNETVAVGVSARASGSNATAMGRSAVAGADNTVALGYGSQVDTANSVALGANARVIAGGVTGANSSIAIGNGAVAGGTNSIIIGTNAQHIGSGATVLGSNASAMGGSMGVAVGYNSSAAGASAVSVGTNALASGRNSVAMGLGASATSINSVALGYGATGSGEASTTMGTGALATGYHGVSLGANANSAGRDSVALGTNANAANTNSVALGNQSIANRDNSVSVGSSTLQRQITNLAAGTANTDAVNLGQMNAAISNAANPYVAVRGTTAANATGTSSIAIGDGAIARNTTTAAGQTNIAIGARANTSGGFGQLALGDGASTQNSAAGGAIAIGRGATTTQRGVALGDGASVTAQFGVALGDGSLANQENTVSVGNATTQRRIVNLAAGTGATDAVNVSQLTGVTKALGGGAAVGADGGITNPTYNVGGTDYHNVGDALDALAASGIGNPNAVIYDDATKSTVTLGGTGAAAPVALKNVADAKDDHDALNLGQLKDAGLVGDDGAGNLTSLAVTYDGTAKDSVTLGGAGATTPVALHNVADGVLSATSKDAVNGSQLFATNTRVGDLEDSLSKGGVIDPVTGESLAVVYDGNAKDTVTLAGTNGTTLSNVKAGVADMDAVNVSQLKDSGLIDPSTGKSIAAVTYDSAAKDSVTLGGASATPPVALHNVADGVLSATSKDAVNGSQLFATNQDLGNLKDSLKQGGVIDPVTGESLAVVYDGNAKDTVTLAGTNGTTLSNVKAGVADMDAVNVSQLKDSGLIDPSTGKSIAAVTYDRNADGTPNYGTVTLGNGAGPTQIKNVATGVDDTDAVNVKQLNTGLSDLEDRMSGGNLRFVKVNADPVTGTPAVASGALAVAIGSDARATSANSLALGSGARVTGAGSVAIGYNSVANQNNVVSVGDVGRERKIVNVADGDVAFQSTDAVNGGQLYAALNTLSTSVTSKTQQAIDTFSSEIDKKTQAAIDEVNSRSMQPMDVSDPLVAIEGLQGNNVASLNGADPTKATAAAIGSSTAASGANAVAVGLQSGAGSDNSVAIGSFAQTGAGQDYSVAVGSNVQTNGTQAVALGANAQANGDYALAVGNNGAQAIGDGSIAVGNAANVRAGSTNAIAIGTGANVARSVEGAMALGANATAGAANSIALGENAFSNRANALSIGRAGAERQIVNVAAGTQTTDAVNVSQLKGVTDSLGGGTTIGADGSITKPTYKVGGSDYHNVGDALDALASRTPGDPNAVAYDSAAKDTVTLGGAGATTPVALKNVADAKDDGDALNLGQLKDAGLVGDDGAGNLTSLAVTYDGASKDSVTLGGAGAATPVALHNVADGVLSATSKDAVNGSQLFATNENLGKLKDSLEQGGAIDPTTGESLAVVYDGKAKDAVTLGGAGATAPVALKNVADGTERHDAINLGQLQDAGLVAPVDPTDPSKGLTSLAVTYDGAAKDVVTLAGTNGTTLSNVKAGVADMDAVNVSQLKDAGLIDPSTGKPIAAVTYDSAAKDTVTLGGAGATTPVALKNVADAKDDGDALNLGQLKDAGLVGDDGTGNLTSLAVTYDAASKDSVTLGGAGAAAPVALHNVADGVLSATSKDAVNGSQLFTTNQNLGDLKDSLKQGGVIDPVTGESLAVVYDSAAKDSVTLGNAGTPVGIHNLAAGAVNATSNDAINGSQLFTVSKSVADKIGGGAGVGADGSITDPTYSVGGQDYHSVGDALGALDKNSGNNPLAVVYDGTAKDAVTLGGAGATTPVALKNVADAKDDGDALNLGQLKSAGLVGDDGTGNLTSAAVTYDKNADGTINHDKATLAGTNGTTLSNVKAGVADMDAVNVSQLKDAGLIDPSTGKSIAAVTYDSAAKDSVTLGGAGATTPVALKNVADAKDDGDALNLGQLKNAGLVGDDGTGNLTSAAMTYDKNADGTINHDKATLAGTNGTTLSNVKAGVADMDAVNVSQLKDAGLIDPSTGKSIAAVTYDSAAKDTVTLGGAGATTPVALKNVADAKDDHDALNLGQMKDAGLVGEDASGKLTSAAVTYDKNADGTINHDKATLAGTNGTTLSNVKAGVADMDAVNVSQLKDAGLIDPSTGKSMAAVTYDSAAKDTVTLGGAGATTPVALKNVADGTDRHDAINLGQLQDAGLVAPVDPTDPGKGLKSLAVAYDSATQDVVTLKGADGTTITNVKAGAVTATSTDAINGAQLHGTAQSVADSLGGGSTVDADGKVTNPSYSLADPADASKKVAYDNVGGALANLDGRTLTNTENITVINKQLGDSGLVDPVTGQSIAAVTYDRNADGTPNKGSVTLGGAGATTPVALKNVADGVDTHDAVNLGQLQNAGLVAPVDPTNPGAGLTSLAVTYDKHADGSANFDQITLKGANGSTITNVKAGAVSATSTDAVNGAQLHGVSQSVAKSLGGGASVDADGNVTNPSYKVSDKTFDNVGDAIENISNSLVHGSIGLVQQDDTTREITVAKDTDGTTVNFEGTAGARVLTGVGAGAVSATSNDAINGSQLHGTAQSVADAIGGGTTVDADGKLADTSIEVNGNKYKTVAEAVQAAAQYGATDSLAVRYDLNADGTPNYGSVTLGGTGAAPVRVTNVADGASKYDAVNFGQLSELNDKIGGLDDRVGALEQNPGTGNPNPGGPGNEYFAGTDIGSDGTTPANAGDGTGNTAAGSNARVSTGVSNGTAIGSGAGVSKDGGVAIGSNAASAAEGAVAIGRGSDASGSKSSAIGDGAKATGANSVALGSGSQASEANTVSFGNGTDDGNRRIVNIRDGINETDAATKGQLDRAVGGLQGQVNDLSRNAYSGIAAATALTMIPGVDPGKTVSFGIGGATYKGYQAVAFGGEARITQNLKMKAGVGMSSGGNTVGVGASYQW